MKKRKFAGDIRYLSLSFSEKFIELNPAEMFVAIIDLFIANLSQAEKEEWESNFELSQEIVKRKYKLSPNDNFFLEHWGKSLRAKGDKTPVVKIGFHELLLKGKPFKNFSKHTETIFKDFLYWFNSEEFLIDVISPNEMAYLWKVFFKKRDGFELTKKENETLISVRNRSKINRGTNLL
jgi:hypothetical protein